jgi:DNA-binding CsgD family transcriptional regulator
MMNDLTNRERQIFDLLMEGRKTDDVADKLGITKNTVKYFIKRIYKKLKVKSKPELIIRYQNEKTT